MADQDYVKPADPSIFIQKADPNDPDLCGIHNADLDKSATRIINTGSWKKQDTIMLIPTGKMIPAKAALSMMNMAIPPNNGFARILMMNTEVGEAYSLAISHILAHEQLSKFKFILTVEHDNVIPPLALLRLLEHMETHPEYAAISSLYWTKGPGGVPQIWGDPRSLTPNFRPQPPDPGGGLVECYGIGMGCAVWRLEMFKDEKLRKPWFKTLAGPEGVSTQDLYFWNDARKNGYRCAVACDVRVGHLDWEQDRVW